MNISMVYDGGWWGTHSRLQGKEEHHLDLKQRREQLGHPNSTHWALQPEHQGIPRLCRRHRHTVDSKNTWTLIYESLTDSILPTWITLSKFGTPGNNHYCIYHIDSYSTCVYIYTSSSSSSFSFYFNGFQWQFRVPMLIPTQPCPLTLFESSHLSGHFSVPISRRHDRSNNL